MSHLLKGGLIATTLLAGAAQAATVEVSITNNQGIGGLYLTPLLSIFHDGTYDSFDVGSTVTPGVEEIAEEGEPGIAIGEIDAINAASGSNHATAVLANPGGFSGAPVLDPGEVTTLQIDLDTSSQRFFSFLSMVIPSNDTFIGNDNPLAYELFDASGAFVFNDLIEVFASDAWDGGTEGNDGNGAAFAPPTGTDATDTSVGVAALADLDFLIGRPQAPGGTIASASGLLASISITEVAAVPLPAGLPLLLGGLGAFGLVRGRRRKT